MTREEAIKILSDYEENGCGFCHQGGDEVPQAFEMAVKSLKAWDDLLQWLDMIKPKTNPRTKGWIDCIKQIYREHMKEVKNEQTER